MARQRIKVSYTTAGFKRPHISVARPKLAVRKTNNGKRKA